MKAIIFDLDGTLISERDYMYGCFNNVGNYIANQYGLDNRKTKIELIELFDIEWNRVFNRFGDNNNIKFSDEDIRKLVDIFRKTDPVVSEYDDLEVISNLYNRNIRLGIITNGRTEIQRSKIEKFRFNRLFDMILLADELGQEYWKPHMLPYEKMKQALGIDYKEMIFVGDNLYTDIIGAKQLGIETVYIDRKDKLNRFDKDEIEEMCDYVIESLSELITKVCV